MALPHYIPLLSSQSYPTRRSVAGEVARSLLKNKTPIATSENLDRVLQTIRVLIRDGTQQGAGYPGLQAQRRGGETDETIEEQGWLARLVHLVQAPDNDTQLKVCWQNRMGLFCISQSLTIDSFYKQPARHMLKATNESATQPQQ